MELAARRKEVQQEGGAAGRICRRKEMQEKGGAAGRKCMRKEVLQEGPPLEGLPEDAEAVGQEVFPLPAPHLQPS